MSRNRNEIILKSAENSGMGRVFSLAERVLRSDHGDVVKLRRQSADVLSVLIHAQEKVVSKTQLLESVWDGKAVTDDSLSQCVADIRRALVDDSHSILVTHPRKGYQLLRPAGWFSHRPERVLELDASAKTTEFAVGRASQPSSEPRKSRVAVLAFDDFSPGPDQGYLSDAFSEGIITELAKFQEFATIARNSSFSFRETDRDIRKIAETLDADVILEGSQQKLGEKLSVSVQLIEAEQRTHLWSQRYEGRVAELFEFQADIIRKVASTVGGQVTTFTPRVADRNTVTAMHLNAKGFAELQRHGLSGNETARPFFEAAINADPNAAFGFIGMGFFYCNTAENEFDANNRCSALKQATKMAAQALELEPHNNAVHYLLGRIATSANDLEMARAWFDKAKVLNPSFSNVYAGAATEKIYRGETNEAIEDIRYAISIDPLHPSWFHSQLAWALWQSGDCQAALASLNRIPRISAGNQKHRAIYQVCVGDVDAAQNSMKTYLGEYPKATLTHELERQRDKWSAPGQLERWLDALRVAGMPE